MPPCSTLRRLNRDKTPLHDPIVLVRADADSGVSVAVALQWCSDSFSDTCVGYANSIKTVDGGTHMDGMRAALTRLVNNLARKSKVGHERAYWAVHMQTAGGSDMARPVVYLNGRQLVEHGWCGLFQPLSPSDHKLALSSMQPHRLHALAKMALLPRLTHPNRCRSSKKASRTLAASTCGKAWVPSSLCACPTPSSKAKPKRGWATRRSGASSSRR